MRAKRIVHLHETPTVRPEGSVAAGYCVLVTLLALAAGLVWLVTA